MANKIIIICLLLSMSLISHAQKNDKWMYACEFISGSSDGINQAVSKHYFGRGRRFWDINTSWMNKYRDWPKGDKRAAYFGSKSILVWTTDGYHLTRFIEHTAQLGSLYFALGDKIHWKQVLKKVVISGIVNRASFCLFYNVIY